MMSDIFRDFLDEQLKDDEFRKEYEKLQPELDVIKAVIDAGKESGLMDKDK